MFFSVRLYQVLQSGWFDSIMGTITFVNAITIGVQLDAELRGEDTTLYEMLEAFFFTAYTLELAARFFSVGTVCLRNSWVKFDLATNLIAAIDIVGTLAGVSLVTFQAYSIMKMARLAKMVRA